GPVAVVDGKEAIHLCSNDYLGLRSEEHTSELQSHLNLVCRLLLEKKYDYRKNRGFAGADQAETDDERLVQADFSSDAMRQFQCAVNCCNVIAYIKDAVFAKDTPTTAIFALPPHDALPI